MKRLSGWDAMLLYSETPNIPTHTLKIAVIDAAGIGGPLTFERFQRIVGRKLPELDPLRYRLVDIPLRLHHPMWTEHRSVDVDRQVVRATVSGRDTRAELNKLIGDIASAPLPRDHPLWQLTFVEGCAPGVIVLVAKVHHALADGVASANLLARAMDSPSGPRSERPATDDGAPTAGALIKAAMRDHGRQLRLLPGVVDDTLRGIIRMRRRAGERGRHPELARPFSPPATFFNHAVSPGRRFATATIALADAKAVAKCAEATINDLVLAMSAGALRDLMLRLGDAVDTPLMASVPVNTDPAPDRISGNALGALFVSLPVHVADPAERIRLTKVGASVAKENNSLLGPTVVGRWTEYFPPPLAPAAFRRLARRDARNGLYNLSISNVRGPAQRAQIAGAPIVEFHSVGPLTAGSAMNITVWSYVDQLNFAILTDDRAAGEADDVAAALLRDFALLHEAMGVLGEPRDMAQVLSRTL